jgi:hypothetical protein
MRAPNPHNALTTMGVQVMDEFDFTCKCGPDRDDCAVDCQCACHCNTDGSEQVG